MLAVNIPALFPRNFMGLGQYLHLGADLLNILRTGLNTGRKLSFINTVVAAVTLVLDPVARKIGQQAHVKTDSGLTLGNIPRADSTTLGSAQTYIRLDAHNTVLLLFSSPQGQRLAQGGF
eukprot:TRINITY_DN12074_c0_g3_i1.p4 TRINITY_DN12074_c0_g3~~TRINITY_DN12074_c0_g3_i1.p4  ORF type:complete len:120 (+),score=16.58 TRINITY_DN12074_c0_g3_i1:546-905(+)